MARKASTTPKSATDNKYNDYVKELEAKVAMYEAQENPEEITISQTDYIKVMSLLPYRLNLCTRERGQGKVYRFDKLFQVKKIIYSDLVDILEVNRSFMESGYFIILSPKVVRLHGLDEVYSAILTKEKIEQILDGADEELLLYSSANEKQKEVIIELVMSKLAKDPDSIDLNMVDKLSRLSGIKITERAESARALLKTTEEQKKNEEG